MKHTFSILGLCFALGILTACDKREDNPKPSSPHVAGSWVGTGTDDAIGFYNISMDLTQSGESASGTFTMAGDVGTVTGSLSMGIAPQTANNMRLTLSREHWTLTDPANSSRLCIGTLTAKPSSITSGTLSFFYTMTDCQGGTWTGGANAKKTVGTN